MDELRLKIAIAAMQGLMNVHLSDEDRAAWAFRQADAMISECEADLVESTFSIKKELVKAIKEEHPDLLTSELSSADILIHQLKTGLPF